MIFNTTHFLRIVVGAVILTIVTTDEPCFASEANSDTRTAIASRIDAYLEGLNVLGAIAVSVTVEGETVLAKGYGLANVELGAPATIRTKFRIGSITKQFMSMAIMILEERGRLSVDDTLGTHLLDVPQQWAGVTLHQLLTHTSGIMHSWALPGFTESMMIPATLNETLARFHEQPLVHQPGTQFSYSGVGYFLLARVIEVVSGREYGDFLRAEIFSPLLMDDSGTDLAQTVLNDRASGYRLDDGVLKNAPVIHMPVLTGGGNLYSTAEDLSRWDRALTAGLLISKKSYSTMYQPELKGYAYGWFVGEKGGKQVLSHGGAVPGFRAYIVRVPSMQVCVVVLSNLQSTVPSQIAQRVLGIVREPS